MVTLLLVLAFAVVVLAFGCLFFACLRCPFQMVWAVSCGSFEFLGSVLLAIVAAIGEANK